MRSNHFYLNCLLCLIALFLGGIILQNQALIHQLKQVQSQQSLAPVSQVKYSADQQKAGRYAIVPVNEDGSIDIRIKSGIETMDVNIRDISSGAELNVDLERIGGSYVSGKLPVEMK